MQQRLIIATVITAVGAVISLLAPWVRVGGTSRSTIELIGAAGALDVISGFVRIAVVAVWFAVPLLGASALLCFAAQRTRLFAAASGLLGLMVVTPAVLLLATFGTGVAWGAFVGGGLGAITAVNAVIMFATAEPKDRTTI